MTSLGPAWKRIVFALRGGARLNGVEDENTARGFHLLLACVLLWILLLLLVGVPFFAARPTSTALICAFLGAVALGALCLVRASRIRAASFLFRITIWCVAEVAGAFSGGLRSGTIALSVLIIVNAGWLLGRASAITLAAATLLIALAESLAAYFGHPLPIYFPSNPIGLWIAFAGYLLFALNPILAMLETLRAQVAALRESEERFRRVFEEGRIGLGMVGNDFRISKANSALCRMLDYTAPELAAMTFAEFTHPDDRAQDVALAQRLFQGEIPMYKLQKRLVKRNGAIIWANLTACQIRNEKGVPLYGLGMLEDITERKRAEEDREKLQAQLVETQKMESIGRLAGGVAHDFNNLLTVINGYSQLILAKLNAADPLRASIVEIHKAGKHATGLTQKLLAFSRQQLMQPSLLDVNRVMTAMRPMLASLVGDDVELSLHLHPGAANIYADLHQLEQVVMNLAANARDAMPRGGRIVISTTVLERAEGHASARSVARAVKPEEPRVISAFLIEPDESRPTRAGLTSAEGYASEDHGAPKDHASTETGVRTSSYVVLTVTDSGTGMDEETRRSIFEPFFTTKPVGKGTGLGLSMAQGIVEQSGGYIEVASEPGHGVTFTIYLTRVVDAPVDSPEPESVPVSAMGGTQTVLVVEDQAGVREFAAEALRAYGYRVIQAENAGKALALCEQELEGIDLVLTDIVMPNLSGTELADRLRIRWPAIKVLFMSAYADAGIPPGAVDNATRLLQKPFSPDQLAIKVREILVEGSV